MTQPSAINTDHAVYLFFENLKQGDSYTLYNGKRVKVLIRKPLKISLMINDLKIILTKAYGNWHTSLTAHGHTKQLSALNNLHRDIEGEIIMNLINARNPLHEPTQVYKAVKDLDIQLL